LDSRNHRPIGAWVFDEKVAEVFDDMAERSIPFYHEKIDLLCRQAAAHLEPGDTVLDLGVATGETLLKLQEFASGLQLIGVDASSWMLDKARKKIPNAELIEHDLRRGLPDVPRPKIIFLLWTAQFVPIEYRAKVFADCRRVIEPGGRLYVAEKLRGQTAAHEADLRGAYWAWKERQGYSREAIRTKAESLEGALVSMDAPGIKAMISRERWSVEELIRYLGFAAWQCVPI